MKDNDAMLYSQFLKGNVSALEELIRIYSDNLVRFAYLYVKDSYLAEDVAEDTFATLFIKRKKFTSRAKFKTYLYTIAKNKCVDCLRKNTRNVSIHDLENVLQGAGVEEDFSTRERNKKLYRCVHALPEQYKDVIYLAYLDGFEIAEICRILGKNKKQVYNLLSRAKLSLKEKLIKEGVTYEDV